MTALTRGALTGAALGLGWGLVARIWMRAITTEPEFSWVGTLIILGFAAWLGLGAGVLAVARATGQRPWPALLGAPGLLLFAGPGLLFLPSFALGGLALSHRAAIWRVVGLLAVVAPVLAMWSFATEESLSNDGTVLFAVTGFAMLSAGLAVAGAAFWTPSAAPSAPTPLLPAPRSLGRVTAPLVLVAGLGLASLHATARPAAAAQLTEPVEVTVRIATLRMINTPVSSAQSTVRFGFNPVQTSGVVTPDSGSDGKRFTPTNWRFTHVIVPQPATEDGHYPIRIEGIGSVLFFAGPLDLDPHVCSGGLDSCAGFGVDRPAPDDRALDLTLNLNESTWTGPREASGGQTNIDGTANVQACVQGTSGDPTAAEICFTISWQLPQPPQPPPPPPPPTLTVTKEQDSQDGVCDSDCSLREALLAVPDGGATIVLPHDDYELTIPRDPTFPDDNGATGHLAITKSGTVITGTGDPGGTVIRQKVSNTRVLEVHGGADAEVRDVSIVGGASSSDVPGTAVKPHIHGGGIHNHGILTLRNVTVSGNRATSTESSPQVPTARGGGGIYNAGTMTLINVTIADNESPVLGSGLGGSLTSITTLRNTLIVNNGGGGTNCTSDLVLTDGGGNLQYPGASCGGLPTATHNPVGAADPTTGSYPLPFGSPAIDPETTRGCPDVDQLGTPRPQLGTFPGEARCDIGAIERVNRPPTATIDAPSGGYASTEGSPVQLSGRGSDPDGDSLTYRWSPAGNLNDATVANPIFTGPDEGQFPLTLTVNDGQAISTAATSSVTVVNVAPTVRITGSAPSNPIRRGAPATVSAIVTDPGVSDTITCTLEWDDGTGPQPGTVIGTGVTRTCSGSHTFAAANTYTVTIRASDGDGGIGLATTLLVAYDPSAGSLAGIGQIDSVAGALQSLPTSTGRAAFAAAAAYRAATSTTPTGTVTWRLTSPDFRFASTSLSWLVVSGPRFQVSGTGQVNGAGSYRFLLTGTDGQRPGGGVDRVRLRVWSPSTGNSVVYDSSIDPAATDDIDNARPSPLRAGNIAII